MRTVLISNILIIFNKVTSSLILRIFRFFFLKVIYLPFFFKEISNLHELWYFDGSCNRISKIDPDIQYCSKLKDLHLSFNNLKVYF